MDSEKGRQEMNLCDDNTSNALEALDSVNATQSNALDCISRAKAIEALTKDKKALEHIINEMSGYEKEFDRLVGQRNQVDYDIYEIKQLPPALGTNLAEVGTDCISRQAAIDALTEYGNGRAVFISVGEAVIRMEQLPSAQPERPEIIRCRDCKHWDGADTCDVIDAPVWDNDFCSMAERRTDEA